MTKWEYTTITQPNITVTELDKLGQQGWELITMFDDTVNGVLQFVFKRPIPLKLEKYFGPDELSYDDDVANDGG